MRVAAAEVPPRPRLRHRVAASTPASAASTAAASTPAAGAKRLQQRVPGQLRPGCDPCRRRLLGRRQRAGITGR
ncbi:MAG: hypothetical protein WDN45_01475 [Caulobacteraceae bacterium]